MRRPTRARRVLRRTRDASPQPPSPADSGYDSLDNSHVKSPTDKCFRISVLYGPGSYDGADPSPEEEEPGTPCPNLSGSVKANDAFKPLGPKSRISPPTQRRRLDANGRALDRYVPRRDPLSPLADRYRTTKTPQDLSVQERIVRKDTASIDPFSIRGVVTHGPDSIVPIDERVFNRVDAVLGPLPHNRGSMRQISRGAVWSVGGLVPGPVTPVDNGEGHFFRRSLNSRVFSNLFHASKTSTLDDIEKHEGRIATALDIDRHSQLPAGQQVAGSFQQRHSDDFYCSPLAYSFASQTLAICLGNLLYAWTKDGGVKMIHGASSQVWLTSIAFSSEHGARAILGIGQSNGSLVLRSMHDDLPRFEVQQRYPIACVSWRPTCTLRPSKSPFNADTLVQTEELVVGDEMGTLYYYVVEWPTGWEVERDEWPGSVSLVAKISIHSQQICGLAWAPDGKSFASGGNDNLCCLFDVDHILEQSAVYLRQDEVSNLSASEPENTDAGSERGDNTNHDSHEAMGPNLNVSADENVSELDTFQSTFDSLPHLGSGLERHRWVHGAAVKAIAFCPWRRGLIATGGGSNDKCIHFFHTTSGTSLATISVSAQVTSLIWSTTRREIAATFGYAQPEHPYRIAIFSWPECNQVAAIPWEGEWRALYAVPYPRGPAYRRGKKSDSNGQEGCIVVASSDKSIKFHEVWSRESGATVGGRGMLGGSDILEGLEGINKEGDVIR
ncbi:WD40-repeat-containing domain protein [Dactylonectria macrodidyma]|uniref:WD40-repeat-containing domain protein n=1 Tax=Dactylonectria macrodidyma TaxID=307937 RepID=A0A9P9ET97_9HYPO|nr:WD40-repeat-containing domain protein [Dactylonectria macrodidyma]